MNKLTYLTGDATNPQGDGLKMIIHICNDKSGWGAGFVVALSKKWKKPEEIYRADAKCCLTLGNVHFITVEKDIMVCNMIAQHGMGKNKDGHPPIRYDALIDCLRKVNLTAIRLGATIHAPRIGAGLAGGNWTIIEAIIKQECTPDVFIYDLPKKNTNDIYNTTIFN